MSERNKDILSKASLTTLEHHSIQHIKNSGTEPLPVLLKAAPASQELPEIEFEKPFNEHQN